MATANHGASMSRVIFVTKWLVSGGNVPGNNLMGNEMADGLFLAWWKRAVPVSPQSNHLVRSAVSGSPRSAEHAVNLDLTTYFSLHLLGGTACLGCSSQEGKLEGHRGLVGSSLRPGLLLRDIRAWSGYCLQMSHHIKRCDLAPLLTTLGWEAKAEIRVDFGFGVFFGFFFWRLWVWWKWWRFCLCFYYKWNVWHDYNYLVYLK